MTRFLLKEVRYLPILNVLLLSLIGVVIAISCFFFRSAPDGLELSTPLNQTETLPSPKWGLSESAYQTVAQCGLFEITTTPVTQNLPDLRTILQFFGKNLRPDAKGQEIYVGLAGRDEVYTFHHKEKVYLTFKKETPMAVKKGSGDTRLWGDPSLKNLISYNFSPDNTPTPLMVQFYLHGEKQLQVTVSLNQENGRSENNFVQFNLSAIEPRHAGSMIGSHKLDPSILIKQKAKWHGKDCFLQELGGDEYADLSKAERVEFVSEERSYTCYFKENEAFIWKNNRWEKPLKEETSLYPLLILKKVDDKTLGFEAWDLLGHRKIPLNLIKTKEIHTLGKIKQELKFIGAKTWGQFILESLGHKFTVKPNDWLIFTDQGWHKLDSESQIDAFVNGELVGPLLVIDKLIKKEGQQRLSTLLFSPAKSSVEKIELASSQGLSLTPKIGQAKPKNMDAP